MRQKQALSGPFRRARAVLGRLEVEGTWQKDPKRRLIVRLDAEEVAILKRVIADFEHGIESTPTIPERAEQAEQTKPKGKTWKTIRDEP